MLFFYNVTYLHIQLSHLACTLTTLLTSCAVICWSGCVVASSSISLQAAVLFYLFLFGFASLALILILTSVCCVVQCIDAVDWLSERAFVCVVMWTKIWLGDRSLAVAGPCVSQQWNL